MRMLFLICSSISNLTQHVQKRKIFCQAGKEKAPAKCRSGKEQAWISKIKETLEKQLQLLSERSRDALPYELMEISHAMVEIALVLTQF